MKFKQLNIIPYKIRGSKYKNKLFLNSGKFLYFYFACLSFTMNL